VVGNPVEKILDRMHYHKLAFEELAKDKLRPRAAEADDDRRDCDASAVELMKHGPKCATTECSVFDEDYGTLSDLLSQIIELLCEWLEARTRTMPDQLSVCVEQPVDVEEQAFAFLIRVGDFWACAEDRLLTEVSDAALYLLPDFTPEFAHLDRVDRDAWESLLYLLKQADVETLEQLIVRTRNCESLRAECLKTACHVIGNHIGPMTSFWN
jgi:hypothetical protein